MQPHFTYGNSCSRRAITPDDPWPTRQSGYYVKIHHDLMVRDSGDGLIVHDWPGGLLQLERLNALQAAGYKPRRWLATDREFWEQAQRLCGEVGTGHILDHPYYLAHEADAVMVCHSYAHLEDIQTKLRMVLRVMGDRWDCDFASTVDERFNIYFPGNGFGYEIRRPAHVRAKRASSRRLA